jgi:Septum formation
MKGLAATEMSSLIHRGRNAQGGAAQAPDGEPARRRRLLIILTVATVVAVGAIAAATVVAVHLVSHHPRPAPASASLRGTAFLLRPGQCFNSAPNGIDHAHAVPCGQPHRAEIYASFSLAGARWPGTAAVARLARAGCQARLSSYVNPAVAAEGLSEVYLYPNQGAWQAGTRHVVCEIRAPQPITGSVRS